MIIHPSIVLTAIVPEAKSDICLFAESAARAAREGADTIEFYSEPRQAREYGRVLKDLGLRGVYLAAYLQKQKGYDLCSSDAEMSENAVSIAKTCIEAGAEAGAERVLLTSGRYPAKKEEEAEAWTVLKKNLRTLAAYADGRIVLSLEPGDREVDAMQLAGPTEDTVKAIAELNCGDRLRLTMDTSHLAQLGEDPESSLRAAVLFCDHVHIANCVLKKGALLYGDKHPFFDEQDVFYTRERLMQLAEYSLNVLQFPEITVSAEVISRGEEAGLERLLQSEKWLFHDLGLREK